MEHSKSAQEMSDLIREAIRKHEITHSEFDKILMISDRDGHLDSQEKLALAHLRDLIEDKTVRLIADR